MTKLDLIELRKKAEAAAPGPWRVESGTTLIWGKCDHFDETNYGMGIPLTEVKPHPGWGSKHGLSIDDAESSAHFIAAANPAVVLALIAEIDLCHARLEIDHVWQVEDGKTVQKFVPYAERVTIPDGIECRDATIHLYEERNKEAEAEITRLRSLLTRAGEALRPFADEAFVWHCQIPDSRKVEIAAGASVEEATFTVGDLRTARTIASEIKEALNNG